MLTLCKVSGATCGRLSVLFVPNTYCVVTNCHYLCTSANNETGLQRHTLKERLQRHTLKERTRPRCFNTFKLFNYHFAPTLDVDARSGWMSDALSTQVVVRQLCVHCLTEIVNA